jgi:hypothetical protein
MEVTAGIEIDVRPVLMKEAMPTETTESMEIDLRLVQESKA